MTTWQQQEQTRVDSNPSLNGRCSTPTYNVVKEGRLGRAGQDKKEIGTGSSAPSSIFRQITRWLLPIVLHSGRLRIAALRLSVSLGSPRPRYYNASHVERLADISQSRNDKVHLGVDGRGGLWKS
jgi:hypothetical protein